MMLNLLLTPMLVAIIRIITTPTHMDNSLTNLLYYLRKSLGAFFGSFIYIIFSPILVIGKEISIGLQYFKASLNLPKIINNFKSEQEDSKLKHLFFFYNF